MNSWLPYKKGAFPFLYDATEGDRQMDWLGRAMTVPRTWREWWDYMGALNAPLAWPSAAAGFKWTPPAYPDYKHGAYLHPYFHRATAADMLGRWWYRNQRMRWICRKWLWRTRTRRMSAREHGATMDLGTCEPIPEGQRVTVFDIATASVYHFHTATIHKALLKDLLYQRYAVSEPTMPKNPYTNIPWTAGQLCVILGQVQENMWRTRHRFVDCVLVKFRQAGYDIPTFQRIFGKHLTFRCAVAFFRDPTCDAWEEMYEEVFDDLVQQSATTLRSVEIRKIRNALTLRSMPAPMLENWDNLVIALWMRQNYGDCLNFVEAEDLYVEVDRMLTTTNEWFREQHAMRMRKS